MIRFECDYCGGLYQVQPIHQGRRFECRQCGEVQTVPHSSHDRHAAVDPEFDEHLDHDPDEDSEFEQPDARSARDRSFDNDPAGGEWDQFDDESNENRDSRPRTRPDRARRRSTSRPATTSPGGFYTRPGGLVGIPLGFGALTFGIGLASPQMAMAPFAIVVIGAAGMLVFSHIKGIIVAFREGVLIGLFYLFLPLYPLYHLVTRWQEQRDSFLMSVSACLVIVMQFFAIALIQR